MAADIFEIDAELVGHDDLYVVILWVVSLGKEIILIAILDRSHIGDARTHIEDMHLLARVEVNISSDLWTWAHEAHVADEYIDELRQMLADRVLQVSDGVLTDFGRCRE